MDRDERAFLELLHARHWPNDIRLIYADWLDEHDQDDAALIIRRQVLRRLTFPGRYDRQRLFANRPAMA